MLQQMDDVRGLCAPRIRPRYPQCFISSSRSPSNFVINVIGFVACREINAFPSEFFPPVVIGVAAIHTNHASWLVIEAFSHIDLMFFARSGKHEVRQIGIVFEAKLRYTCAMVWSSLQKAIVADLLLARNRFRTNNNAVFLWDSSALGAIRGLLKPLKAV